MGNEKNLVGVKGWLALYAVLMVAGGIFLVVWGTAIATSPSNIMSNQILIGILGAINGLNLFIMGIAIFMKAKWVMRALIIDFAFFLLLCTRPAVPEDVSGGNIHHHG